MILCAWGGSLVNSGQHLWEDADGKPADECLVCGYSKERVK